MSVTSDEFSSKRLCVHFGNKNKSSNVHHVTKNVKDPVWRGVQLSVLCFKRLISNAFNHCTRCGIISLLYISVVEILCRTETLHVHADFKEVQTLVRDLTPLRERSRCEESETREEKILKALERHQTGKTPTHNRAEKALRSSQVSLNGSLSANCTTQPPWWTTLLLLSTQIHMSAEWRSGRARSLSLWSFHFTASDSTPKCCDICFFVWRLHVLFPSQQKASCRVKHVKKTNKNTTLWMGGFWFLAASVHRPYEAVRRVLQNC